MKKLLIPLLLISSISFSQQNTEQDRTKPVQQSYKPNWSSLRRHATPEWLDGLKFGIYCHRGPQTIKLAHKDKELSTLEAIENWKGEKFSAKEWVDLFQAAGAQFGGPGAWHGSGNLNWKSDITD